jgi:hypothetical protein
LRQRFSGPRRTLKQTGDYTGADFCFGLCVWTAFCS